MTRLPSTSQHRFSQVPSASIQRSSFDRSHGYKTTFDAGQLVPVFVDEVLPGDTFSCRMTAFARLATALRPIMDNMYLDSFFFFVPTRLVWNNWERFNGAQDDPDDSTDFLVPRIGSTTIVAGSVADYMGIPVGMTPSSQERYVSALPFRAYRLIWNEWFRDQNLQDSISVPKGDGPDSTGAVGFNDPPLRRGKRHDYFTSCLPWPQKGPSVTVPFGEAAPVIPEGSASVPTFGTAASGVTGRLTTGTGGEPGPDARILSFGGNWPVNQELTWEDPQLVADLTQATGASINAFRQAFQVQRLLERDARGGTRYIELLKSHFGVTSPDARLQRPEYLGGGSTPISVAPVANTTGVDGENHQGDLAGVGTVNARHGFTKSFTEHGYIIGMVSVRADLTYQQGLDRMWSRKTRFDFYWPALSHLGEQAVLSQELYVTNGQSDSNVFGYQERYAEYRYKPSRITGQFRSTDPQSLDIWHLAQHFGSAPTLGPTFIQEDPPIDRIIATPDEPQFLLDTYFKLRCSRPMPVYSVPGLIDHF